MANFRHIARGLCSLSTVRHAQNIRNTVSENFLFKDSRRRLYFARNYFSTDIDDKAVAVIINKNMDYNFCVSNIGEEGFTLANGQELVGPVILFPHSLLSWHVQSMEDVTEESLVLFKLLEPKIDLLIFGYGGRKDFSREAMQRFSKICKNLGLRYEALPTEQACGLFNFLADERRFVAAALIPPSEVDIYKLDKKRLYLTAGDEDEEEEEGEEEEKSTPLLKNIKPQRKLIK